ncbi:MAG: DUF6431 domain-containing protein [Bacilli bacterium]
MITFKFEKCKLAKNKIDYELMKSVNKIAQNINEINAFNECINITSFSKNKEKTGKNLSKEILLLLHFYLETLIINDYSDYKCPICKNKNTLKFHKCYYRNIVLDLYGHRLEGEIKLIVLKCDNCFTSGNQKYHTLMPDFIAPYHSYALTIILDTINLRLLHKMQIENIIYAKLITKRDYYRWITKFNKYVKSASLILGVDSNAKKVIHNILIKGFLFYEQFFDFYEHPFFLFKPTCVPLSITP